MNAGALALVYLFHPLDALDIIKRERAALHVRTVLILYAAALAARILGVFITHYPLSGVAPEDINLGLEALKVCGLCFSWVVAAYAISSIAGGEATFGEMMTASAYALVPYAILTPVFAALTNVMSLNDAGLYDVLTTVAVGWIALFLYISFVRLNGYGFWKGLAIGLVSLVFMLLVWGLLLLLAALSIQTFSFLQSVYEEISMKWFI